MANRLRTVIIGAGQIAAGYDFPNSTTVLTHAHAISLSKKIELVGFYDIDRNAARKAAEKWGVRVVDDISSIKDIDVVCCAVPDVVHDEVMRKISEWKCLRAVICEKPLADAYEKACDIKEIYDRLQVPVFVNYSRRYLPEFNDLKEWIFNHAGELILGNCIYGKGITHNCSHLINLLLYLLGDITIGNVHGKTYDFFDNDPSIGFDLISGISKINFNAVPCDVATVFEMDLFFKHGRVKYDDAIARIDYYNIRDSKEYPGYQNYYLERSVNINRSQAIQSLYENVYEVLTETTNIIKSGLDDSVETLKICRDITEKANR